MKMTDKLIVEGIIFMIVISMYMIWSNKPIIHANFWRTYFYTSVFLLPLALFLTIKAEVNNSISLVFCWSIILFLGAIILFNFSLINKDELEFSKYCTSKNWGIGFCIFIIIMLSVAITIKIVK